MHLREDMYLSLPLLIMLCISFESEIVSQRLILKVPDVMLGTGGTPVQAGLTLVASG